MEGQAKLAPPFFAYPFASIVALACTLHRDPSRLGAAADAAAAAIARRYGTGAVEAPIQAIVVTVRR